MREMVSRFVGASICCLLVYALAIAQHVRVVAGQKRVALKCSNGDNQKFSDEINELCGASMCVLHNYKIASGDDSIAHPQGAAQKRCMTFQKSTINMLPVAFFRTYASLVYVDLRNSRLQEIDDYTFSMERLEELILSGNEITELSQKAFAGAHKLRKLDLSHNLISFIDPLAFTDLNSLDALNLSHNKIDNQSFSHNDNEISIDWSLENLKTLDLSHNKIVYYDVMPFQSFAGLTRLEELYLQHNEIPIDFGAFASNRYLKTLDYSYNNVPYFDMNILLSARGLENLYLNGNGISYASQLDLTDAKSSFPYMKSIGIAGNSFACEVLATIIRKADKSEIEIVVDDADFVRNARNIRGVKCI